jgi:O-antigen/teichoic acid export membrane protein
MFWIGAATGIFFSLFGRPVIEILYGNAYIESYPALVINIWAGIFVAQSVARGIWIITENLQRYRLLIQIVMACGNVLGNIYLIPVMGINGAALATLLSQCLGTWGLTLLIKPLRASTISMLKAINPVNILWNPKEKRFAWN